MKDKLRNLADKYIDQEGALFNINSSLGTIKVNLNEASTLLDSSRRDQDS